MNLFLEDWKKENLKYLSRIYPNLTEEQILSVLDEDISSNFIDPNSLIHNDYQDNTQLRQPLSTIYRFSKTHKPILAGNGTLFKNQNEAYSPVSDLIDDRMVTRKMYKGKMKDELKKMAHTEKDTTDYNTFELAYEYYDMMQAEAKIRINSIYGSFGAPSFQLYNKYTAASTTGTAQSLISCTGISFEALLGDNVRFKSFDECIIFMNRTIDEDYVLDTTGIELISDVYKVKQRMINNFDEGVYNEDAHSGLLDKFLSKLSVMNLTKIYYKNNIYEFVLCDTPKNLFIKIFDELESFDNPNDVPDIIKDDIDVLWSYIREFVFYNHCYTERINRLRNDKRAVVKLIDTDSNLIYVELWKDFVMETIIPYSSTMMSGQTLDFAIINTITYVITHMLEDLLKKYCMDAHVLERNHHRINMKNEFCFKTLLLAPTKKRYVGHLVLREGERVDKVEIKGHDFKKAGVTEYVNGVITTILDERIIKVAPNVDIPGIYRDLSKMEKDIELSLMDGERKFLLRMNCKGLNAYKNPWSMGQVLSVLVWDTIYPDKEILVPDKLDVVLLDIHNVEDLEVIRNSYPYEYDKLVYLLTMFEADGRKIFAEKGIKYMAIPNNIDGIPDFIKPFIDVEYIKARNIGTFKPILDSLGCEFVGNRQRRHFSNILAKTKPNIISF